MVSGASTVGSLPPRQHPQSSSNLSSRPTVVVFIALGLNLAAFALRVWRLSTPSFWWDDSYSTLIASNSLPDIVNTLAREDFHPPLHYFLLHYWMRLAGMSEFALRFPSVVAGVLTVAAAGATAHRLFGPSARPLAMVIFGVSPFLWYYSQEARMFSLAVLFVTLAIYFCARAADTGGWLDWGGYGLFVALGLWDFYYSIFLPLGCGVWVLLSSRDPRRIRRLLIASIGAGASYLPWLPIFLTRTSIWSNAVNSEAGPLKVIVWSWPAFLLGLPTLGLYASLIPAAILYVGGIVTVAALIWSGLVIRRRPGALLATLAFVLPLAAMAAISIVKPIFHPRYAITAVPGLFLLLTGFIATIRSPLGATSPWSRWPGVIAAAVLIVASAYGLVRLKTDPSYSRDDYRSAIAYIDKAERPTDVIIHNAVAPVWYYYHGTAPASFFPSRPYSEANVVDELNLVTAGRARLWYLADLEIPNDPDGFVDSQLRFHARQLDQHTFGPLRVQLWEIPGSSPFRQTVFQPVSIDFADQFAVNGYSVSGDPIGGNQLDVELNLSSIGVPKADDGFWVALADQDGQHWGRADVRPHDPAFRLSGGWGAQTSVGVRFDLPVAVGTPPGRYRLVVGAYRLADLAGLDVLDSSRHPIGQEGLLGAVDVSSLGEQIADSTMTGLPAVDAAPGLVLTNRRVDALEVSPGDRVPLTLVWRASRQLADLNANVTLKTADGQIVGSTTGPVGGTFSLARWPPDRVVREQRLVSVAPSSTAGDATVSLQVSGGPEVSLGTIKIRDVTRVFAAPTLGHPLAARFGESISLVGFELSAPVASPGGELTASLGWRADRPISTSYHVFLHLLDAGDKIWGQWDGVPRNWTYPMTAWLPGEYILDRYTLRIGAPTSSGNLSLEVGLYDAVSGQRVSVVSHEGATPADHLILGEIRIVPP